MVYLFLLLVLILEITHFGKKYTHQDPKKEIKSTEKMDPWNSLDKPIISEIYRQYWLDLVFGSILDMQFQIKLMPRQIYDIIYQVQILKLIIFLINIIRYLLYR